MNKKTFLSNSLATPRETGVYQKLVLFDVDGTLITGTVEHEKAFSDAFRTVYGVNTNISIINHLGMTDQEVIIKVLKKNGLAESEIKPKIGECMDVMVKSFQKLIKESSFKPLRGARKLLRELSERDVLMGLATGNLEEIARGKMRKLRLNDYFKVGGFGSDDIHRANLIRLAIKRAEKKFNFKPDNNIFLFGDTPRDINAAKEAGVKIIGVKTKICSKEDLLKCDPDYILEDLSNTDEILTIIFPKAAG